MKKPDPAYPLLLWIICSGLACAQVRQYPHSSAGAYLNTSLGFRYMPPDGEMRANTPTAGTKSRGEPPDDSSQPEFLLTMQSGVDDTASTWCSLAILTYPRDALGDLDDKSAEAEQNAKIARFPGLQTPARHIGVSGQDFAVSVFRMQEGGTRKGAVVWTTVRKRKLLSFAFVANSPDRLKALTETMKTVEFF